MASRSDSMDFQNVGYNGASPQELHQLTSWIGDEGNFPHHIALPRWPSQQGGDNDSLSSSERSFERPENHLLRQTQATNACSKMMQLPSTRTARSASQVSAAPSDLSARSDVTMFGEYPRTDVDETARPQGQQDRYSHRVRQWATQAVPELVPESVCNPGGEPHSGVWLPSSSRPRYGNTHDEPGIQEARQSQASSCGQGFYDEPQPAKKTNSDKGAGKTPQPAAQQRKKKICIVAAVFVVAALVVGGVLVYNHFTSGTTRTSDVSTLDVCRSNSFLAVETECIAATEKNSMSCPQFKSTCTFVKTIILPITDKVMNAAHLEALKLWAACSGVLTMEVTTNSSSRHTALVRCPKDGNTGMVVPLNTLQPAIDSHSEPVSVTVVSDAEFELLRIDLVHATTGEPCPNAAPALNLLAYQTELSALLPVDGAHANFRTLVARRLGEVESYIAGHLAGTESFDVVLLRVWEEFLTPKLVQLLTQYLESGGKLLVSLHNTEDNNVHSLAHACGVREGSTKDYSALVNDGSAPFAGFDQRELTLLTAGSQAQQQQGQSQVSQTWIPLDADSAVKFSRLDDDGSSAITLSTDTSCALLGPSATALADEDVQSRLFANVINLLIHAKTCPAN